jgi:hypothetical protein
MRKISEYFIRNAAAEDGENDEDEDRGTGMSKLGIG